MRELDKIREACYKIERANDKLSKVYEAVSADMLAKILRANEKKQNVESVAKVAFAFIAERRGVGNTPQSIAKKTRLRVSLVCDIMDALLDEKFIIEYASAFGSYAYKITTDKGLGDA